MPGPFPGPFPTLGESMVARIIPIFAVPLSHVPSEGGEPREVPVRSIYTMERTQWPLVTVRVILGDVNMQPGENILYVERSIAGGAQEDFLAGNGEPLVVRGIRVPGTQIVLDVLARSDPERYYIIDTLMGALLAGYTVLPSGEAIAGELIIKLKDEGLVVSAIRSPRFPDPVLSEARPQGQSYYASLVVMADAWITWDSPALLLNLDGVPVTQEIETIPDADRVVADASSFWTIHTP